MKRTLLPLCIVLALAGCRGTTGASAVPAIPQARVSDAGTATRAPSVKIGLLVTPGRVVAAETTAILGANDGDSVVRHWREVGARCVVRSRRNEIAALAGRFRIG